MIRYVDLGRPQPKQEQFLRAQCKYVAFGGARGGGKSWAVRAKAKALAYRYPGIKILIVRRTYPELLANHIEILRDETRLDARYNDKDKMLRFYNGSMIHFDYCQRDSDLGHYQGVEYDVIFVDEATQMSEHQLKTIAVCMRGVNAFPKRIYYTCNPGGQGHGYIKRLFVDRRFEAGENPDDYLFIQALVDDNTALMEAQPEYVQQLEALPPKLRDAWRYGRWDVYEGQFFEEWRDDPEHYNDRLWTHVIEPFEPPASWTVMRVFDWGYNRPFACEWVYMDYDENMYVAIELYGCTQTPNEGVKWTPEQVFSEIHRIETEHPWLKGRTVLGYADPAIWDGQRGESIAETAAKHQVFFSKGDNARIPGWMQMHYRLAFDDNGFPRMYFFRDCKGAIRTLPLLIYDEHRPEDIDTDGEDHIADALRYGCMARMIAPRPHVPRDPFLSSPIHQYLDINKSDLTPPARERRTIEIKHK